MFEANIIFKNPSLPEFYAPLEGNVEFASHNTIIQDPCDRF